MENSRLHAASLEQQLLDQGPACGWIFRPDFRIERVYGAAARLFSRSAGDLRGRSVSEIVPSEARAELWRARLVRAFAGERVVFREGACGAPAPNFWVELYPLRSPEGEVLYAGGLAYDISTLSASEDAFRRRALHTLEDRRRDQAALAQFLHDQVAQDLTAAGLQLDLLRMDLESAVEGLSSRTAAVQNVLEKLMNRVREFSYTLNPAGVGHVGLHAALDRLAGRLRERGQPTLRLMTDSSIRLPAPISASFFVIAEEAAENALRHSGCSLLEILLKSTRNGPTLEVRDNGAGFDTADAAVWRRGLGLSMMEHSASQAGILFALTSEPAKGTIVQAVFPVGKDEQQHSA